MSNDHHTSVPTTHTTSGPWRRGGNPAFRRTILDDAGEVAICPTYVGALTLPEAQANAELITSGTDEGATPGPWTAELEETGTWLVFSPDRRVVAQVMRHTGSEAIARRIVEIRAAVPSPFYTAAQIVHGLVPLPEVIRHARVAATDCRTTMVVCRTRTDGHCYVDVSSLRSCVTEFQLTEVVRVGPSPT